MATSKDHRPEAIRERVQGIIDRLPEAVAVPESRHLSLEVRKKRFGWFLVDHDGDGRIAVNCKSRPVERERFLEALPLVAHVPKYVGRHGWVGLWLDSDNLDWEAIEDAIVAAYRMTAPKSLLQA